MVVMHATSDGVDHVTALDDLHGNQPALAGSLSTMSIFKNVRAIILTKDGDISTRTRSKGANLPRHT